MLDAIVVGSGLFGQIIHKKLWTLGLNSVMMDRQEHDAGSGPAACLMKPSWFSSLGKDVYEPSLRLLDGLYGVHDISFKVGPVHTDVHWCDPSIVLGPKPEIMDVQEVGPGWVQTQRERFEARTVVVAAGVWTGSLVPVPGLTGRAGAAFLWPSAKIKEPFISPWAPYRQLVAFNRGDGAWVGDGTAIKPENWSEERLHTSAQRCARAVGLPIEKAKVMYGVRPYVPKVKPCYLDIKPGLIVATGGAKNGTLAAGWCAHRIAEELS